MTFDDKLDKILLSHGAEQGELHYSLKQAIKDLVLRDVVGEGEMHYSHLCPPDSIDCAKFQQREQTRHYQHSIINGKESSNE